MSKIRKELIDSAIKEIKSFGYIHINERNLFTDDIFKEIFENILYRKIEEYPLADEEINQLLKELK